MEFAESQFRCMACETLLVIDPVQAQVLTKFFKGLPPIICSKCDDEAKRGREDADRQQRVAESLRQWADLVPADEDTDPEKLPDTASWVRIHNHDFQQGQGVLLHGRTRAGKSRMGWLLLKAAARQALTIEAATAYGFGRELAIRFRDNKDAHGYVRRLERAGVLLLDDLDKLCPTSRAETELFGLVEERVSHRRPTIVTTNQNAEGLVKQFERKELGAAIISRLRENCATVFCTPREAKK